LVLAVALAAIPAKVPAKGGRNQPQEGPTKLLRFADISKDKWFCYAGDLWIAARRRSGTAADFSRRRSFELIQVLAGRQMDRFIKRRV